VSQDESSEENPMKDPFFCINGEVGLCPPQIDDRYEDVGGGHFGDLQNPLDELGEFLILEGTGE
jgi:hypothetical protein